MSKTEKAVLRLLCIPRDFTWEELIKVLNHFGFFELKTGKTGGSRRKFADSRSNVIILHKSHPGNIVKEYVIRQIIELLTEKEYLKDE